MNTEVPLYPDGKVPFAQGTAPEDTPTLTLYPAEKPNGAAVVVCPGGGYGGLAGHEGEPIAKWLNTLGVFAAVLKYRLGPKYHHPAEMTDALTAIKTVRSKGREWGVGPKTCGNSGVFGRRASHQHGRDPLHQPRRPPRSGRAGLSCDHHGGQGGARRF